MAPSTVTVFVASPDTRSERRYDLHLTVDQLKVSPFNMLLITINPRTILQQKLESVTGISVESQLVTLHETGTEDDVSAATLATLDDDSKPLGYYSIRDFQVLKVRSYQFRNTFEDLFYRR